MNNATIYQTSEDLVNITRVSDHRVVKMIGIISFGSAVNATIRNME